jgi:hypothetical protein
MHIAGNHLRRASVHGICGLFEAGCLVSDDALPRAPARSSPAHQPPDGAAFRHY